MVPSPGTTVTSLPGECGEVGAQHEWCLHQAPQLLVYLVRVERSVPSMSGVFTKQAPQLLVYLVRVVRSVPSMSGAFTRHHSANIVRYSVSVIPPFPKHKIRNRLGSLKDPRNNLKRIFWTWALALRKKIKKIFQDSSSQVEVI